MSKMNESETLVEKTQTITRQISKEHGIEIGCTPGTTRPNTILSMVLEQIDELSENDFIVQTKSFGDWYFAIYCDKEDILDKNYDKIFDILQKMYNQHIIRYASIHV